MAEHTGQTDREDPEGHRPRPFMSSEEAKAYGLIDQVLDQPR